MSFGFGFSIVATRGLSLAQRAIALLRALGTSAHVWLPGANGTTVASLPSNNYLLSDGSTGYSTVDGVDGLTLDGMGALSSTDLAPSLASSTGWTLPGTVTVSGGAMTFAAALNGTGASVTGAPGVVDKTYKVVVVVDSIADGLLAVYVGGIYGVNISVPGTYTYYIKATANGILAIYAATTPTNAVISSISFKEYTGTHLTQATTANKPLERRGMFNELLNSATPATQSVTCIAAPYTLALYGTGNVVLSGTGSGTLTGTGAADLVVLNFTPTAGSVTFTKSGTVTSFGLFKGTWTAAQILAEGGIPTTTATAASNPSAGKYWWSFDGSNDSMLSGNLGITNACTIVIAGRVNAIGAHNAFLAEGANGLNLSINTVGEVELYKTGFGAMVAAPAGTIVAGVPFTITARLSGGTAVIRKNGVQVATAATATTFSATTGARIGTSYSGTLPFNGALGWVVPIAAALSDADCLTVERLVSSQFPNGPVF